MVNFFKEKYDINIEYLEEAKTLPGRGEKGSKIAQIFNVQEDSYDKFDAIKSDIGAFYVKEIVRKGEHRLFNERIYKLYFQRSEKELLKAGEISEEDVYKEKF